MVSTFLNYEIFNWSDIWAMKEILLHRKLIFSWLYSKLWERVQKIQIVFKASFILYPWFMINHHILFSNWFFCSCNNIILSVCNVDTILRRTLEFFPTLFFFSVVLYIFKVQKLFCNEKQITDLEREYFEDMKCFLYKTILSTPLYFYQGSQR